MKIEKCFCWRLHLKSITCGVRRKIICLFLFLSFFACISYKCSQKKKKKKETKPNLLPSIRGSCIATPSLPLRSHPLYSLGVVSQPLLSLSLSLLIVLICFYFFYTQQVSLHTRKVNMCFQNIPIKGVQNFRPGLASYSNLLVLHVQEIWGIH